MAKTKMKAPPIKQIFFNHFEKMIFAVCLILAIWMITQNQWMGTRESQNDLLAKADAAAKRLAESKWPETERTKLTINDYQEQARKISLPANNEQYALKDTLFWPLNPKKVPASEPEWFPVEDLIVDADRAILALKKGPGAGLPQLAAATPKPSTKTEPEEPTFLPGVGEFSSTTTTTPGAVGAIGGPGGADTGEGAGIPAGGAFDYQAAATAFSGLDSGGTFSSGLRGGRSGRRGRRGRGDDDEGDRARGGAAPGAGQLTASRQVRGDDGQGYRYVSIRGVYPWKKQLTELVEKKAFDSLVQADNPELFSIVDFQIERKEATPGENPWAGEWEKIDVEQVQKFLLEKSFNFDPDPVDPADTDPSITMPIPMRAFGGWPMKQVTHPRIKTLSAKQLEESLKQQEEMLKNIEAVKKEEISSRKKRGFAGVVQDYRAVRSYQAASAAGEEEDDERGRGGRRRGMSGLGGQNPSARGSGMTRAGGPSAANPYGAVVQTYQGAELLLFRFFDLNVDPGRTYQYRVRLVLTNPNSDKTLLEVMEPHVREGELRETQWSKPSEAVEIPDDYDIFLARIRAGESQDPLFGNATFNVYEWEPSIGTFILGLGQVRFGDLINFNSRTRVLRLHKKTADVEPMEFKTADVLLDGYPAPTIKPNEHPDLATPNPSAERPLDGYVLDEAIVLNQFGEMEVLDPLSRKEDLERAKKAQAATIAMAEIVKKEANKAATDGAAGSRMRRGRERD